MNEEQRVLHLKRELSRLFLVSKMFVPGLNKIKHGCLEIWNFSSRIQLAALTRELPSACPCIIREFKKLRRQLQRKRHIKIELCVKLSPAFAIIPC